MINRDTNETFFKISYFWFVSQYLVAYDFSL